MRHRVLLVGVGAMPVFDACWNAGNIAGYRVIRLFPALLYPPLALQEVEDLFAGVPMPVRAPAALKGHLANTHRLPLTGRYVANLDGAGEVVSTPLPCR